MSITVRIDELVLHGVAPGNAASVGDALRQELARMLAAQGAPRSLARARPTDAIDGGSVHLRERATPERIGHQLAAAVYGALEGK